MRSEKRAATLLLVFIASVLKADGAAVKAQQSFGVGVEPPRGPAFQAVVTTAEQDPGTVEASLGLDRPARRLIQQGLRNEGFDPGAPDGLFGPRTRAAIRSWQASRGASPSGYLDGAEAELLRGAGSPADAETGDIAAHDVDGRRRIGIADR